MTSSPPPQRRILHADRSGKNPLSHHEIMRLVAPFSARGYTMDMAASNRSEGLLMFRPTEVAELPGRHPGLLCRLRLERPHREKVRITRTIESPDGLAATLVAEGIDPAVLLDAVEAVDPARQVCFVADVLLARDYRILLFAGARSTSVRESREDGALRLVGARARIGPLTLSAKETDWRDFEFSLTGEAPRQLHLTEDLLAVLGWSWRPIRRDRADSWSGSVKAPAREPRRTPRLEQKLDATVRHLSKTLDTSPALFHRRFLGARWRAAFQRSIPLLTIIASIVCFVVLLIVLPKNQLTHFALLYGSVGVIVALSLVNRAYRLEIPPSPRPLTQQDWCSYGGEPS